MMTEWLERYRGWLTLGLLVAFISGAVLWWERRPLPSPLVIAAPTGQSDANGRMLTVDISGAVTHPGVYALPEGSRVADALTAAGGETDEADISRVNRALKLRDEQQVVVPRLRATPGPASSSNSRDSGPMLVDLNDATIAQLDALPGIGSAIGQRIITYRDQHGPFSRIEQLKDAKLVPAATFDKIKDMIAVQ